jgi:6-phosphogluconolactonase (cycloisomerase 2 family)
MTLLARGAALAIGAAATLVLGPANIATADGLFGPGQPGHGLGHAVFVQTDNPTGNQVIVLAEHSDGRLSERQVVSTGGLGAQATGSAVDHLASQGSLVYDGAHRLLFAVNAGSGTLSVLTADGRDIALQQVLSTGGEFPDSVAVYGNLVYVLNAGGTGSVTGYRIFGDHLFPLPGSPASLGLNNTNPPNFLQSPGEIGFSPDGTELLVTTKASTSSIDVFSVGSGGQLSANPTVTADGSNVPFSFSFSPQNQLVVAEAGPSAVHTFSLGAGGTLTSLSTSLGDGQAALCWIASADGFYYVANAGSNDLSAYAVAANGTPSLIGPTGVVATTDAGPIDLTASADGKFLYSEDGGAGAVDEFQVNSDGSLSPLGSVAGLGAGIEGIAVD